MNLKIEHRGKEKENKSAGRSTVKTCGKRENAGERPTLDGVPREKTFTLFLLTVEMLLLGSNHLLRGGLADGLCEALTGDAVPRGQQPVVDRLSRHTVPLSQWVVAAVSKQ